MEPALEYFCRRAHESKDDRQSSTAIEAYLILLSRTGRAAEALAQYGELVDRDRELSAHAPTLLELAQASGDWDRYNQICRDREDMLGFAAGLVAKEASD